MPLLRKREVGFCFSVFSRSRLLCLLFVFCVAATAQADEPIAVIVRAGWQQADAIALTDLQKLYLGKRISVFGQRVECLHLAPGSPVREGFVRSVLARSESSLELYWLQQALTGGRIPPREFSSVQEVLERVRTRPYQLGYVPLAEVMKPHVQGVQVLHVLQRGVNLGPTQPEYPIRYSTSISTPAR